MAHQRALGQNRVLIQLRLLAEAARRLGAPGETRTVLERTHERIRYLTDLPLPAEPGEQSAPGTGPATADELPDALAELIEQAQGWTTPDWITNLLITAHLRLAQIHDSDDGASERRLARRHPEDQAAHLRRADGSELTVLVADRSPLGLGLFSEHSLAPHELVGLTILGETADEHFQAEVIFCLTRGATGYHVGVELLISQ